ncbi:MAG: hypothetical protein ABW024_09120 [Microbacterium sp.]
MSADATATSLAAIAPKRREASERRLQVVEEPARRRRPKLVYGVVAVLGAFLIGAAQMGLSILTTQTSYEISSLTSQQRQLTWDRQILADDLAGLSSPQFLAANAAALGMVIGESPNYLRLSDGALSGTGQAATWISSVDAYNRGSVANSLISSTPLVTEPDATIVAPPPEETPADLTGGVSNTPPPITDGLPTPNTH